MSDRVSEKPYLISLSNGYVVPVPDRCWSCDVATSLLGHGIEIHPDYLPIEGAITICAGCTAIGIQHVDPSFQNSGISVLRAFEPTTEELAEATSLPEVALALQTLSEAKGEGLIDETGLGQAEEVDRRWREAINQEGLRG